MRLLPQLLREQEQLRPGAAAVVDGDDVLSFGALASDSSRLAAHLRRLGVGADDLVGIHAEPSIDLMVAVWGVVLSGGAYLPLSTDYPADRLRFMIEDSRTRIVVCQEGLEARLRALAPSGTRVVTLPEAIESAGADAAAAARAPTAGPRPGDLAYVIYTSGSTGRPKGVMIEHRSVANQLRWLRTAHALDRRRIVLQKTPLSFDAAQWEILAPACGTRVVMAGSGAHRDPRRLIAAIKAQRVTTLQCVPTLLRALLSTGDFRTCTSLAHVFSGGEVLTRKLALRFVEALPRCGLVNLYGPTECTINTSALAVDPLAVERGPSSVSIGRPVRGTAYHILDDRLSPAAVGEVGELCISGVQVARGYLHRPELTRERFVPNPYCAGPGHATLYRTGDLASFNPDGTVQFAGRADNQVKLRGCRIELDEIGVAIETHDWVESAAVIARSDERTGSDSLIAFVQLNPEEAALMDQGADGAHHRSKHSKLQVRAQLANMGCRADAEIAGRSTVDLPGRPPTADQRRRVFARKTYRFYEGGKVARSDILRLLDQRVAGVRPRDVGALGIGELGTLLRFFGQYLSPQRLLPKYGYASPGALYATQMVLELSAVAGLNGTYYYHPVHHRLVLVGEEPITPPPAGRMMVHFAGRPRAIERVYEHNVREVLELEAGHMVGLFEAILPRHGLTIAAHGYLPAVEEGLALHDDDLYLGTFEVRPWTPPRARSGSPDVYVQAHPGGVADLPAGQYRYEEGALVEISRELILRRHVIAINQQAYDRASFGMSLVSRTGADWLSFVELGRMLQLLSMNALNLGFMSAGYSSRGGHDLPSASRLASILAAAGKDGGHSYFVVGGRVSDEQVRSEGMKEDLVHMKGPAELIEDDLKTLVPDYMLPSRVVVLDRLPLTASAKVDRLALLAYDAPAPHAGDRAFVAPRTATEERVAAIWRAELQRDDVSVHDDFFDLGGDSLTAVALIHAVGEKLGRLLPLQTLFEAPTVEQLAERVDGSGAATSSRLVALRGDATRRPIYCWPGLGGYTMNLRGLANELDADRPFLGVQAHGINADEHPHDSLAAMAEADVRLIRRRQPAGPYTLWGYSFGARVAFEAARQLEQAGERVDHVFLIAPGSPRLGPADGSRDGARPTLRSTAYVTILYSVFAGSVTGPALQACLEVAHDEQSFASFVSDRIGNLDPALVRRIMAIVRRTYGWAYASHGPQDRWIRAPVTVFRARGDERSFAELGSSAHGAVPPTVIALDADHYGVLRDPGVQVLVELIRHRLGTPGRQDALVA